MASVPAFAQHEDLEVTASGKCRCKITGHEMAMQQGLVEVGRHPAHFAHCEVACNAPVPGGTGNRKPRTSGEVGCWARQASGSWHNLCGCKATTLVTVICRISDVSIGSRKRYAKRYAMGANLTMTRRMHCFSMVAGVAGPPEREKIPQDEGAGGRPAL